MRPRNHMNADLVKKALEKVPNPNILVNLVSRRVRQLNSGAGGTSRPLVQRFIKTFTESI